MKPEWVDMTEDRSPRAGETGDESVLRRRANRTGIFARIKKTVVETAATDGFGRVRARRGTSPSDWRTGLAGSTRKSFRRQSPPTLVQPQFTLTARLIRILRRVRCEFLEPRIIPKRIEHRIEPEQRGSERRVHSQCAFIRYRE